MVLARVVRILLPAGEQEPVVAGCLHAGSFPKTLVVGEVVFIVVITDGIYVASACLLGCVLLGEALFFCVVVLVAV